MPCDEPWNTLFQIGTSAPLPPVSRPSTITAIRTTFVCCHCSAGCAATVHVPAPSSYEASAYQRPVTSEMLVPVVYTGAPGAVVSISTLTIEFFHEPPCGIGSDSTDVDASWFAWSRWKTRTLIVAI